MTLLATTELEAVNAILGAVGESPIVALDDDTSSFTDASLARAKLHEMLRRHQLPGWTFNTEEGVTLTPDGNGFLYLPSNTIKFLYEDTDYVQRGLRVYNRADRTYVHTAALTEVTLVLALDFDECPQPMRDWASLSAALLFQSQYQGADRGSTQPQIAAQDEVRAKAAMQNHEAEVAQLNVLTNSGLMQRIKQNR